ncbi:MAG: type II toxin-antitoxin system HicA family toxin [Chloroflexota bacterium]|nr:type II toxin-antitoxin system HicA family toxin [Chloroflexota bacterium]
MKLPALTDREVIAKLRKLGFVYYRAAKGSHEIYRHPDGRWTMVPRHAGKTISRRTMRSILNDIRMSGDDFLAL